MSQRELVRWIAFFKLQNEESEKPPLPENKRAEPEKVTAKVVAKKPSQKQKDDLLLQQLFALVHKGKAKKGMQP